MENSALTQSYLSFRPPTNYSSHLKGKLSLSCLETPRSNISKLRTEKLSRWFGKGTMTPEIRYTYGSGRTAMNAMANWRKTRDSIRRKSGLLKGKYIRRDVGKKFGRRVNGFSGCSQVGTLKRIVEGFRSKHRHLRSKSESVGLIGFERARSVKEKWKSKGKDVETVRETVPLQTDLNLSNRGEGIVRHQRRYSCHKVNQWVKKRDREVGKSSEVGIRSVQKDQKRMCSVLEEWGTIEGLNSNSAVLTLQINIDDLKLGLLPTCEGLEAPDSLNISTGLISKDLKQRLSVQRGGHLDLYTPKNKDKYRPPTNIYNQKPSESRGTIDDFNLPFYVYYYVLI